MKDIYYKKDLAMSDFLVKISLVPIVVAETDYGHPERAFFRKPQTFGLGQTNWAEKYWGIWGIFGQFISTHFSTVVIR